MLRHLRVITKITLCSFLIIALLAGIGLASLVVEIQKELPDVSVLKDYQLQIPLRIFSADNELIAEFGDKHRNPVPYEKIPKNLINAVLATEDQRFFEHSGVDMLGLGRATIQLLLTGTKSQGGSTITMQVARNFFLTRKKTYSRKLKEILLAVKIDKELSKEKILELYLNKIYLGNHAYGIAAAAQTYYGKSLSELNVAECAMIAGLPKAPSALNPLANPTAALNRRNHVLARMLEQNYIDKATYEEAIRMPLSASYHGLAPDLDAGYVAEMVRQQVLREFGEKAYDKGLNIYTTIDPKLQKAANDALQRGLMDYDDRHGYRGPMDNLGFPEEHRLSQWVERLSDYKLVTRLSPAAVLSIQKNSITALLNDGRVIYIPWEGLSWARKRLPHNGLGPMPTMASDVVQLGDVIQVELLPNQTWRLTQIPKVEGAIVALNPNNGALLSLAGGFDYNKSSFNRALQANRQPGSSFKPFIYAAALEKGFTLATIINDAPVVVDDPNLENYWRPQNDTKRFYGPTSLREALSKSRNLVSIRLLQAIGIPYALDYVSKFGFDVSRMPQSLSLALGTGTITPLEEAMAYSIFANGGYRITPYLIQRITDSRGQLIYEAAPPTVCDGDECGTLPKAPAVISPQMAYLMTSVLKDVINRGTAHAAINLSRTDLAGKTGTTNDQKDAWFSGYNRNLVAVTWMGFDDPRSLHEYAARAALPIWMDFMHVALAQKPNAELPEPSGLITVKIDPVTGLLAPLDMENAISETFFADNVPTTYAHESPPGTENSHGDDTGVAQLF